MKTLVIAEAGVNHNGSLERACELVAQAAAAGADLVKFQSFVTHKSIARTAPKADYQLGATDPSESQYDMVRKLELSASDHTVLLECCRQHGIAFFSTAFDTESFDLLLSLGVDRVKIPSGEITNLPFLRYLARPALPTILSTGMAGLGDIVPVGYSDHTQGIEVPIAAVALGATVIEKHFTLDRNLPGPDHQASLEPGELRAMVGHQHIEQAVAADEAVHQHRYHCLRLHVGDRPCFAQARVVVDRC